MSEKRAWNEWDIYMVVVAHPDDAEFSSAGTIAKLTQAGKRVIIVQVTSGDKGTIDPTISPEELAVTREAEETEAARRLGVEKVEFLRQSDGELVPDIHLRGEIVRAIQRTSPGRDHYP